ncbi:hypothetical protein BC835DRAFT_1311499 [Cytidiella melzeri]|nr:hypothetical protein BC835DRAFT_1311499 [Cytidiella melzeri]
MTGVLPDNNSQNQRANAAADGEMTMTPKSHCRFYFRAMEQLVFSLLGQLPAEFGVRLDRESFLKSITATLPDGVFSADNYDLGPTGSMHQPDVELQARRNEVRCKITELHDVYAHAIPDMTCVPSSTNSSGEPSRTVGRPPRGVITIPKTVRSSEVQAPTRVSKTQLQKQIHVSQKQQTAPIASHTPHFMSRAKRVRPEAPVPQEPPPKRRKTAPTQLPPTSSNGASLLNGHPIDGVLTPLSSPCPSPQLGTFPSRSLRQSTSHARRLYPAESDAEDDDDDKDYRPSPSAGCLSDTHAGGAYTRDSGNEVGEGVTEQHVDREYPDDGDHQDEDDEAEEDYIGAGGLTSFPDSGYTTPNQPSPRQRNREIWLGSMSMKSIEAARDAVTQAESDMKTASKETIATVIDALDSIARSMPEDPAAGAHNDNIIAVTREYSTNIGKLRTFTNHTAVWLMACRQRVMVSESVLLSHLLGACKERISAVVGSLHNAQTQPGGGSVDTTNPVEQGIPSLARHVLDFLMCSSCAAPALVLYAREYFPDLPALSFRLHPPRSLLAGADLCRHAETQIVRIACTWFGIPSNFLTEARSDFIRIVVKNVGWGMCLLEHTWRIYETMPAWLFNDNIEPRRNAAAAGYVPGSMSTFEASLAQSVVATPTSDVFSLLHNLPQRYESLVQSARTFVEHTHKSHPQKKTPSDILTGGSGNAVAMLPTPTPQSLPTKETVRYMVSFIRDAYLLRSCYNGQTVANATPEQRRILTNIDLFMPLRDLAPSRRAMILGITPAVAKTKSGLFSLLVSRLITYNTHPITDSSNDDRQVLFADLDDFDAWLQRMRQKYNANKPDDAFFCNIIAFTVRPQTKRVLANKKLIWNLVCDCDWEDQHHMSFSNAWDWLQFIEDNVPSVGTLTRYLVLADLCSAQAVQLPTFQDMAYTIRKVDAGALDGLRRLRYLPRSDVRKPPPPPLHEIQDALERFFGDVQEHLAHEAEEFGWNLINAEHSLCKIGRMVRAKFYAALRQRLTKLEINVKSPETAVKRANERRLAQEGVSPRLKVMSNRCKPQSNRANERSHRPVDSPASLVTSFRHVNGDKQRIRASLRTRTTSAVPPIKFTNLYDPSQGGHRDRYIQPLKYTAPFPSTTMSTSTPVLPEDVLRKIFELLEGHLCTLKRISRSSRYFRLLVSYILFRHVRYEASSGRSCLDNLRDVEGYICPVSHLTRTLRIRGSLQDVLTRPTLAPSLISLCSLEGVLTTFPNIDELRISNVAWHYCREHTEPYCVNPEPSRVLKSVSLSDIIVHPRVPGDPYQILHLWGQVDALSFIREMVTRACLRSLTTDFFAAPPPSGRPRVLTEQTVHTLNLLTVTPEWTDILRNMLRRSIQHLSLRFCRYPFQANSVPWAVLSLQKCTQLHTLRLVIPCSRLTRGNGTRVSDLLRTVPPGSLQRLSIDFQYRPRLENDVNAYGISYDWALVGDAIKNIGSVKVVRINLPNLPRTVWRAVNDGSSWGTRRGREKEIGASICPVEHHEGDAHAQQPQSDIDGYHTQLGFDRRRLHTPFQMQC